MNSVVDKVCARNRSSISIEHTILLNPVHQKIANESKYRNNRLQRDKETNKKEYICDVDIVISQLKLYSLVKTVMLLLGLTQLIRCINNLLPGFDFMHLIIFMKML